MEMLGTSVGWPVCCTGTKLCCRSHVCVYMCVRVGLRIEDSAVGSVAQCSVYQHKVFHVGMI